MPYSKTLGGFAEFAGNRDINWGSAVVAGLIGATVIAITLSLTGMNIIKVLGATMLGSDASVTAQYLFGGMMHAVIGLGYGVLYAILFAPVAEWNRLTKGIVAGVAATTIALSIVPLIFLAFGADMSLDASPFGASKNLLNHIGFGLVLALIYKADVSRR